MWPSSRKRSHQVGGLIQLLDGGTSASRMMNGQAHTEESDRVLGVGMKAGQMAGHSGGSQREYWGNFLISAMMCGWMPRSSPCSA